MVMKKAFLIMVLIVAFNVTTPNSQTLNQNLRHVIEYRQEENSRDLNGNELLKTKIMMYLRMQILEARVLVIDSNAGFNSS